MLPKTGAYAKSYDGQTKWIFLLIEDDDLLEKYSIILFGIKSVLIPGQNFTENLSIVNFFWKPKKKKSQGDEVTDFYDKKISR